MSNKTNHQSLEEFLQQIVTDHLEPPALDLSQIFLKQDHSDFGYNFNANVSETLSKIRKQYYHQERINPTNISKIILQSVVNNIENGKFNSSKAVNEIEKVITKYRSEKSIIAFPIANMKVTKKVKFFEYTIAPNAYMKKHFPKMRFNNSDCSIFIEDYGDLDFLYNHHMRKIEARLGYFKFFLSPPNTISSIQIASKYELEYKAAIYSDKIGSSFEILSPLPQRYNSIHDIFQDSGIKKFYNFLNKNSDISSLIFDALAWYNETLKPVSKEIKIVSLFSALESLFGFKYYPSSSGIKIVEITCIIYNNSIDKRSKIYKDVERLREIRNTLIHSVSINQITDEEIKYFCKLVKNIIEGTMFYIKSNNLKTQMAFNKKILDRRIEI